MSNELVLHGCTPTPLANYLKALGVLRLLSAKDQQVKGAWRGEAFVLQTTLERAQVEAFFLDDYQPTPIMAPWNGGSGFYFQEEKSKDKDPTTGKKIKTGVRNQATAATKTVDAILQGKASRFGGYRLVLKLGKEIVKEFGFDEAPKKEMKDALAKRLRGVLPEIGLEPLDATLLVTAERTRFPPLLGTGGNDGNLDFTNNFMQRLLDLMDANTGDASEESRGWLVASLFGEAGLGFVQGAIGQFSPGQAGGPNATTGFGGTAKEADARINPWDFVLSVEGALLFAAAAVRRSADDPYGVLSYPFTVDAVGAGAGNVAGKDAETEKTRGELWMPLWEQAASYAEVRALLAEGRVAVGKKPARDALDFVRAVHQLGGYRGIRSFHRYGLLKRRGEDFLAVPLERIEISDTPQTSPLEELMQSDWFSRFRRFAQGDNISNKIQSLRGQLETAFFRLSGKTPSPAEMQSVLVLLGEIQSVLTVSKKAQEAKVDELPRLSERWVQMADDRTPAFRIARAKAGVWDKASAKPQSFTGARLDDVLAFLRDDAMDARIAALLPGLSLCEIPKDVEHETGEGAAPAAFALLKLCLTPDKTLRDLNLLGADERIPVPPGMLAQLASGNANNRAVAAAWRRLRASGLSPEFDIKALPTLGGLNPKRVAAALLIPLRFGATAALARSVLKQSEFETETL